MRIVAAGGADVTITSPLQSAGADGQTNSTSGIPTYDLLSGFNGTTWDRLRALGDDSDGVASVALGRLLALARLSAYNGATWDRLLSEGNDRDAIANTTLGNLQTLGFPHGYNGASWDRLLSEGNDRDAIANTTLGNLQTLGFPHGYNGATWDRIRTLGDTSLDGLGQLSTSAAIPGATAVFSARSTITSSTSRATLRTPASGLRIRIISINIEFVDAGNQIPEIYFGTGTNLDTTPANAIYRGASIPADATGVPHPTWHQSWPDGAGPVGAADAVLSIRCNTSSGAATGFTVHGREE